MTVDELQVLITADTNNIRKELNNTQGMLGQLQTKVEKTSGSITSSVIKGTMATKLLATAIRAVTNNMDSAIKRLDTLNNYPRVMSNLGVSAEDADASIKRLSDALVGLPTTLDDAAGAVQRFTSANGNVKASTEMFLALNNAILAGGASAQTQATALEQLSQSYAKGKPDMMEWRSAMTAMPAQLKQVAVAMGYASANELGEALRAGTISMDDFMLKLIELNKVGVNGFQSFEEQARNSTGGVATSMVNVKTAITRGITDIMNAIGQSNIAGFFNGIASAINAVIPYVVAFVKVMGMAVSFLGGLFKGTSNVAPKTEQVSNALNSVGASGVSASKGIDETTGSAKKLKKELQGLAGFDEMNVLKEQDDSSGGGSSTGGVGGVGALNNLNLDDFVNQTQGAADKVQPIVDKLLKLFEPLKNINFKPLQDAFKNLGNAIQPLAKLIKGALKEAFEKVIYPIAKFTIEKTLPAFFNLLAGAIKVLTPIIKAFKNVGTWLWDNFLKPIAKWTANTVIKALEGLGKALSKVGDWMSKNQGVVDAMAASVVAFFAAWKITQVMAFVQQAGGIVAALKAVTGGIVAATAAKLADKAETIALTVLYAKDFVVGLASTIATLAKTTAAWVANTVAQASANGVTLAGTIAIIAHEVAVKAVTAAQWLWNAAMSANPIGAVITAIVALTAVVVALSLSIDDGTKATKEETEAIKKKTEAAKEAADSYDKMRQQQEQSVQATESEFLHTQALANELRGLVDEKGNVQTKDEARVQFILGELNEALGTEYKLVDGQIQKYKELNETIDQQIAKKKLEALLAAREIEYREALAKWTETQKQRTEAKLETDKAMEEFEKQSNVANAERFLAAVERYNTLDGTYKKMANDIMTYETAMTENLKGNTDKATQMLLTKERSYQTLADVADKSAQDQYNAMKKQYEDSLNETRSFWNNYNNGVAGYTADQLVKMKEYTENCKKEMEKAGQNINDGLVQGLDSNDDDILKKIDEISDKDILTEFKKKHGIDSPSTVFNGYGQNINQGLINGLNSNSGNVMSTIGGIASRLLSKFRNQLGINSPSKVFAEYGKYSAEGYAEGIEDNTKIAVKSVEDMAKDISRADMPTLDSNLDVKRNVNVMNSMSNQNLIDEVNKLANRDMNNHVTVKIGEDTILDVLKEKMAQRNFETNGEAFSL